MSSTPTASIARVYPSLTGGAGASEYMQQVAGDMNAQVAGPNGMLQYKAVSGGGLEQVAVPALLFLANNSMGRNATSGRNGRSGGNVSKTMRGRRRRGGDYLPTDKEQLNRSLSIMENNKKQMLITKLNTMESSNLKLTDDSTNDDIKSQINLLRSDDATNLMSSLEVQVGDQPGDQLGGSMLNQAIVPATLVLASNMFGKNAMRKMSPFSKKGKRRSFRKRRLSRRFRRGSRFNQK